MSRFQWKTMTNEVKMEFADGKTHSLNKLFLRKHRCLLHSDHTFSSSATAGPDSPKRFLYTDVLYRCRCLSRKCPHIQRNRGLMTECSSTVTTFPHSFAAATTRSSSSGLIVWMLITFALMPSAASFSAAASDSDTHKTGRNDCHIFAFPQGDTFADFKFVIRSVIDDRNCQTSRNECKPGRSCSYAAFYACCFCLDIITGFKMTMPGMVRMSAISSLH